MKQFYEIYQDNEKLATLCRELSWSHNQVIFTLFNFFKKHNLTSLR